MTTTNPIAKGARVRIVATGETGVIDYERKRQWKCRFRVVDYDNHAELGWFSVNELEPCAREPLSAERERSAAIGADLLRSKRRGRVGA